MPVANSTPELVLRRELHRMGLRFRVNVKALPGTPDVVLSRARVAVFVDGCYWHACPEHGTLPKNNRDWWRAKFEATSERDARKDRELAELGWVAIHVWEHEAPTEAAARIKRLWAERIDGTVTAHR